MRTTTLFFATLGLVACRGGGSPGPDTNNTGDDAPPGAIHIPDVQNPSMPPGTPVELHGVIVTAIDAFGTKTGDIWVEEPGGGTFSGIHVFGAATADVAALAQGDIVDITGAVKDEFALSSDTSGRTETELKPAMSGSMHISKSGTGTVPAPQMVDALMIGQLPTQAQRDTEWRKWQGVLITVTNVTAFGAPRCIGSACPDPTNSNFSITGVAKAESSLAAFPTGIKSGDCLASVTGVGSYFFDWLIYPRSTAEVATGGTGCAPIESGGTSCTDGIDNDGNGFADCQDLGCEVGAGAWLGTTCTPADAMCGCSANLTAGSGVNGVATQTASGAVIVNTSFVTAVTKNGFWVADALAAAQQHGAFVFLGSGVTPPAGIVVGAQIASVQGLSGPFTLTSGGQALNELSNATVGTITAPGAGPTPMTATAAQVGDLANGGPFAAVLVKLSNVKVMTAPTSNKGKLTLVDNAGTTITMNDFANGGGWTGYTTTVGTCYSSLVGIMDLDTKNQVRTINPRATADVTMGSGCN
jgi:hypothetical protein